MSNGITRFDMHNQAIQQRIAEQLKRIADALEKLITNLDVSFEKIKEKQ